MCLHKFIVPDAVHSLGSDDEIVADLKLSAFSLAILISFHPLINAGSDARIVELLGDLDAAAFFRGSGDQEKIFLHVREHISEHFFICLVGDTTQDGAEVDETFGRIGAYDFDVFGAGNFGEFPAIAIGPAGHQNLATDDTKYRLENGFIVDVTGGLLLGADTLLEDETHEAEIRPLGKNDVLHLKLQAVPLAVQLSALVDDLLGDLLFV